MKLKLYEQIASDIEQKIRSGSLVPGDPLMGEVEMAKSYNVSRSTVRHAMAQLREKGLITREAGRGTFVQPRLRESVYLAVYDSFSRLFKPNDLFFRVWQKVVDRMDDAEIEVHALALDTKRPLREALVANYHQDMSGVLLLTYRPVEKSDLISVTQKGVPLVLLNRHVHSPGVHSVTLDDFGGMRRAIHYLNELGHTQIGLLSLTITPRTTFNDRIDGYHRAIDECGLVPRVFHSKEKGETVVQALHQMKAEGITGLVTISGSLAISIKRLAPSIGLRIPEDLSIVGFGDTSLVRDKDTSVTHVDYQSDLIGQLGSEVMLDILAGKKGIPSRHIIPTNIVEGGSVRKIRR